jgi:uncharacterized integral membrane protein (TIGR00698 family)
MLIGLAFAVALAVLARIAFEATGGAISATLCAVAVGILWRNLIGLRAAAEPGIELAGRTILRLGIALIGLRLTLLVLGDLSLVAIPIVLGCVALAVAVTTLAGRALGVPPAMRRLLAAGTAICGCTAIIASAPLFRARQADVGIAMSCVVLFGSLAMLAYPWLAAALFGGDQRAAGMFFGAAIHDTSQVVGAALIFAERAGAPDVVAIASLTKFLRTLGLLLLVPLAAWLAAREEAAVERPAELRRKALPLFVLGFIAAVVVRSVGDALAGDSARWVQALAYAQSASEWLLLVGMAAVGLGVTFGQLREAGWRPVALAFSAALATGACALLLCRILMP